MLGDRATSLVHRAATRMLAETLATHLRDRVVVDDEDEFDLTVAVLVDAVFGLVPRWLESYPHLSAEQVYGLFERLATHGLEPLLVEGGQVTGPDAATTA